MRFKFATNTLELMVLILSYQFICQWSKLRSLFKKTEMLKLLALTKFQAMKHLNKK